MILIFNVSPVIVLSKASLLDAFASLGNPSIIPQAVVDEILNVDDPYDPARLQFEQVSKPLQIVSTPPISAFLAGWDLGSGESSVISCASEQSGAVAVLDDLAARRCAPNTWNTNNWHIRLSASGEKTRSDRRGQHRA